MEMTEYLQRSTGNEQLENYVAEAQRILFQRRAYELQLQKEKENESNNPTNQSLCSTRPRD